MTEGNGEKLNGLETRSRAVFLDTERYSLKELRPLFVTVFVTVLLFKNLVGMLQNLVGNGIIRWCPWKVVILSRIYVVRINYLISE